MNSLRLVYDDTTPIRLDRFIETKVVTYEELGGISRSQIKQLIEAGHVQINDIIVLKAGTSLKGGETITIVVQARESLLEPLNDSDLKIVYEDDDLIVIDKPAGMVVHPGAGTGSDTLANRVLGRFRKQGIDNPFSGDRPGIVHRLDKDTSGLLVVAKTSKAQAALVKQFSDRTISRKYAALVLSLPRRLRGVDREERGEIDEPIARHPKRRTEMAVIQTGRKAVTRWEVIERFKYASFIEASLATGRTHQIRVHMAHIGSPIIGDKTYGRFDALPAPLLRIHNEIGRQMLHAWKLSFLHPADMRELSFESPLSPEWLSTMDKFKKYS